MQNLIQWINNVQTLLKQLGVPLGIVFMIVAGILLMTGQEGAAKGKKWLAYILMGLGVIMFATQIVSSFSTSAFIAPVGLRLFFR
ncbi:TrbC/VirB2 family protein [Ethanoligenens sp.]|uniref:TrbC/VirB2 family protein n=1 Tax=Ethanoligenens sp. TaxID=2099655 RepID=UPI0039E9526A